MDTLSTFFAVTAGLGIAVAVMLLRVIGTRDRRNKDLLAEHQTLRDERDEARKQARDSRKQAEGLSVDLKEMRQDLKSSKKKAFKATEQAKKAAGQAVVPEGWSERKEERLRATERAFEEATATVASLRAEIAGARRTASRATAEAESEAARVRAPAGVGEADGARVRALADQVDRLGEKLDRAQADLSEERASAKGRDRDLYSARKLAVQNERSFQVVRGQLDIARERLASLDASPLDDAPPAPADDASDAEAVPEEASA